jgi:hypothetical protein
VTSTSVINVLCLLEKQINTMYLITLLLCRVQDQIVLAMRTFQNKVSVFNLGHLCGNSFHVYMMMWFNVILFNFN